MTIPVNGEYVVTPDEVDVSLTPVYNQQQSSNTNETSGNLQVQQRLAQVAKQYNQVHPVK